MQNIKLFFDRTFAQSYIKQILWLALIMALTIVGLWLVGQLPMFYTAGADSKSRGLLPDIILLLLDAGGVIGNMSTVFVVIVALVGIIVFWGLLISVITNMLNRRVELYTKGELCYHLRNHIVIIGYDDTVSCLIQTLSQKHPNAHILLQTSQAVDKIRQQLHIDLTSQEEQRLVLYAGRPTLMEDVYKLQIHKCIQVYLIGDDTDSVHDATCIDCLNTMAEMLQQSACHHRVQCYVNIHNLTTFSTLHFAEITDSIKQQIDLLPFNYSDTWAQNVLVYNYLGQPIDSTQGINCLSGQHVHVIIQGDSAMAEAFAVHTARIAHFPNYLEGDATRKTLITIVSPRAKAFRSSFQNNYASLFQLSQWKYWQTDSLDAMVNPPFSANREYAYLGDFLDVQWEFIQGDLNSSEMEAYLNQCAQDQSAITSLYLCSDHSEHNMEMALNLPDTFYFSPHILQIGIWQQQSNSLVKLFATNAKSKYHKLFSFGQFSDFYQTNLVPEDFGKLVNAHYSGIDLTNKDGIDAAWHELSVANKWSCMFCANMRFVRLRSLGLSASAPISDVQKQIDLHLQEMMMVEHNRWNMEKLLGGFRALTDFESMAARANADEKKRLRAAPNYAHLDICSYGLLLQIDPHTIKFDEDVIRALPIMIDNAH